MFNNRGKGSEKSCKKCDEIDNESMVQCDTCDAWYHFDCVGVDSSIADRSWSCGICDHNGSARSMQMTATSPPTNNNQQEQTTTSVSIRGQAPNTELNLPQNVTAATTSTAEGVPIQMTFPTSQSATAVSSSLPMFTPNCWDFWDFESSPQMQWRQPAMMTTGRYATLPAKVSSSQVIPGNKSVYSAYPTSCVPTAREGAPNVQRAQMPNNHDLHRKLQLERLEEEMTIQRQYLESKYKILSQYDEPHTSNNAYFTSAVGPSPQQLAARQAIPKQLPTFNGDPDEWPLFISSFENSTAVAGYTDAENLIRLQACLKGKARDVVKSKLFMPCMVSDIVKTLKMCFGRPEYILERAVSRARALPPVKDKLEALIEFSLCVRNICTTMEGCQMYMHLHNPLLVKELVDKLPNNQKLNWAVHPKDDKIPVVKQFSEWLYSLAEAASTVVSLVPANTRMINTHTIEKSQDRSSAKESSYQGKKCPVCKRGDHKVAQCESFESLSLQRKWDAVKVNNLCRQCLNPHRRKCYLNRICGKDGCTFKHHPLLHKAVSQIQPASTVTDVSNAPVNTHCDSFERKQPFFRIVPIHVHSKDKTINTYAFLDEGSSVTLMERKVFDELGLDGENDPLCLRWTGNTTRHERNSVKAAIQISSTTNDRKYTLKDIHTVDDLDLPPQSIDVSELQKAYPYLAGLPIASYDNIKPSILIGVDNWKLAIPLKIREGAWTQPIASKTRLGWTLQGCDAGRSQEFRLNIHTCDCHRKYDELHDMVSDFFKIESSKPTQIMSKDDAKAVSIMNETCQKLGNRFEIGLLWRDCSATLPDSYAYANRRLDCLRKKFKKDPQLKFTIQSQIDNLIAKGYAKKLMEEEIEQPEGKVWYLPIFIVTNPNKPGKVRMVWDAAAKVNGLSLNDFLLSGPDLLNSLVDILLSFRVGRVAICGDIAEMFHRINIRDKDMHVQRFLWYDDFKEQQKPGVYVMKAMTFGLNCAPCIAHFVRDKNADSFSEEFPRAVEAVKHSHYVDDYIDSEDDAASALALAQQVQKIHNNGGFHIRGWSSNSVHVLKQLNENSTPALTAKEWGSTTKVLGMFWDPECDNFKYICRFARLRRDVINQPLVPTKREALQVLMSIFDPLGFVSCYTIGLKILLQDVWRSGIAWDEPFNKNLYENWCEWKSFMPSITAVEIPRCYSTCLKDADDVQLHTFVDAGECAYAAVCYLRVRKGDNVTVALVAAKSKVAPLKPLSIPRLELQAAVIGVRLADRVSKIQRMGITSKFWWSDSKTVLRWLRMDPKHFQQYVMHRIGEILEATNGKNWQWVPSKLNPADLGTKVSSKSTYQPWFSGPEFLTLSPTSWPKCDDLSQDPIDVSEMKHYVLHTTKAEMTLPILNVEYFSDWKRLYRAVATFLLYIDRLHALVAGGKRINTITIDHIQRAQHFLIRYAQNSEFSIEINLLKQGKSIEKSSKLISLNVYLDENGIIRSKGRTEHLNNHEDIILLPNNHYITFLIVRWTHEQFHHQMHESIINQLRGRYHISRLRVLYRKVRQSCQRCKNDSAAPRPPQMAALPAARLAAFERPFTYVGIDYFGPLLVIVGRRREKRWGVLFTCLTLRAVHIEVAHSLDTSSCIMAIQNFISRRGCPREIFSDNGTNFKASEKIICLPNNNTEITSHFESIKWKFNPPSAPHMGGVWERLVRSVKHVLFDILPSTDFNDESLRSALYEVEFIINSRPLTYVSLESGDDEALTPNHLLLGSSDGYKPVFPEYHDIRQRWCLTQKFADRFWHRWVKEYAPIIARRSKWFSKVPPISVGDIVVIVDHDMPRNCWPKGKIINTIKAKDSQVRSVMIQTKSGILHRPVAKVAVLDVGNKS